MKQCPDAAHDSGGYQSMNKNEKNTSVAIHSKALKTLEVGFTLINSEEQERLYPATWQHPTAATLGAIRPGDVVKVGVEGPKWGGERFWNVVSEVGDAGFVVAVNNRLLFTSDHGLRFGDSLAVGRQHIIDVWSDSREHNIADAPDNGFETEEEAAALTLFSESLFSKWGFWDGDQLYEWKEQHVIPGMELSCADLLVAAVEAYLLPALKQNVEVEWLCTVHNPIRAMAVDGVKVDWEIEEDTPE